MKNILLSTFAVLVLSLAPMALNASSAPADCCCKSCVCTDCKCATDGCAKCCKDDGGCKGCGGCGGGCCGK